LLLYQYVRYQISLAWNAIEVSYPDMPLGLLASFSDDATPEGLADRVVEADHRIANNLTIISGLIRTQAARLGDQPTLPTTEVRGLLHDIAVRVEAVARLHRLIVGRTEEPGVDLAAYLREVAEAAMCLVSYDQILLSQELDAAPEVTPKQAVAIGFVVGEAMTNALKYAHPTGVQGKLRLALSSSPEAGLTIEVTDDGVGLPDGFDPHTEGSIGFRIMRSAAEQLGGRLMFDQGGIGLSVRLEIPAPPGRAASRHQWG
jgi:two-component sensor histidine kinase